MTLIFYTISLRGWPFFLDVIDTVSVIVTFIVLHGKIFLLCLEINETITISFRGQQKKPWKGVAMTVLKKRVVWIHFWTTLLLLPLNDLRHIFVLRLGNIKCTRLWSFQICNMTTFYRVKQMCTCKMSLKQFCFSNA